MEFKYKAKKSINEIIEGKLEAPTLEQAIEQLGRQGVIPVAIEPQARDNISKKKETDLKSGGWGLKKVKLFTQKLYNLTKSHVELLSALRLLEGGTSDLTEKFLLEDIIKNIKEGETFSQCLSRYPQYFSLLYVNIIRIGESSGKLEESLAQLLSYLERLEELRMKINQAIAYPIFMILAGLGTIFTMLTFVFPRLVSMFEDFQAVLPLPTRILLATSAVFKKYWILMCVFLFLAAVAFQKIPKIRNNFLSYIKYRIPLVRRLIYKQAVANFAKGLSILLRSGTNLLAALGIVSPVIGNPKYIAQLEEVRQDIKEGISFSQALSKFKIFPEFFIQMIKVGEEGGRLDSVLADIAYAYEQEIESDIKIISSLIEPAIILILGLVIAGMVVAVLLPIFNINTLVG